MDIYQATCYLGKQLFHTTEKKNKKQKTLKQKKTNKTKQSKKQIEEGINIFFIDWWKNYDYVFFLD